jgi:hypothetical protein
MVFGELKNGVGLLIAAQVQRRGHCQQSPGRVKPILLIWYPQIIHNTRYGVLRGVATM